MKRSKPLHSDELIRRLKTPAQKQRHAVHALNGKGLSIILYPSGVKTYVGRYRLNGGQFDVVLGDATLMTLSEAQQRHIEGARLVATGIDPRNAWSAKKETDQPVTCDQYFHEWLTHYGATKSPKTKRLRSADQVKAHARRWQRALSWLHDCPIATVTREFCVRNLKALAARTPTEARLAMQILSQMFAAAEDDGLIPVSPVIGIKASKVGAISGKGQRFLTLDEIGRFFPLLDASRLTMPMKAIFKVLLLTGARRGEVACMRWQDIDLELGEWRLKENQTKSARAFTIHLGPHACAVLRQCRAFKINEFVFPSPIAPNTHIHPDSVNTALARFLTTHPDQFEHFTPHDLRRSAASGWHTHCGADVALADLMLNHALGGVAGVYIVSRDLPRQRAVRHHWDALLGPLIPGFAAQPETAANVVAVRASFSGTDLKSCAQLA